MRAPRWPEVEWLYFVCPQKTERRVGFRWDLAEVLRRERPSLDGDSILFAPVDPGAYPRQLGAYGYLGLVKAKPWFLRWITPALSLLSRGLGEVDGLHRLREVVSLANDRVNQPPVEIPVDQPRLRIVS